MERSEKKNVVASTTVSLERREIEVAGVATSGESGKERVAT
jgi:hypothetical protein